MADRSAGIRPTTAKTLQDIVFELFLNRSLSEKAE